MSTSIDARTRLVMLLGYPVEHSLSPAMHNAALRTQRIPAVYLAASVRPSELAEAVAGLRALGALGANVTLPHKRAACELVDELSPRAAAVGAVNTIVVRRPDEGGAPRLFGDNTDVPGFLGPLAEHAARLEGAEMVVLGAGGAARAVVYALLTTYRPSRLTIAARRPAQAVELATAFTAFDSGAALRTVGFAEAGAAVRSSGLVVNTTPVGMHPDEAATPWPATGDLHAEQIVYDLIYNPSPTRLLREASARGATSIGGLEMLIGQAAASYEQWTGRPMPVAAVRAALRDYAIG